MLKKFVIERDVPGVGSSTPDGFCAIARQSNSVLRKMGTDIQWLETFVVGDKTYCVYLATDESLIHQHARDSGFPANRVELVRAVIDPASATA